MTQKGFEESDGLDVRKEVVDHHRSRPESWYHWVLRQMCLPEQSHILDLGSGPGDLWVENWEVLSPNWRIIIADLSMGMTAEAACRIEKAASLNGSGVRPGSGGFHFVVLDGSCLPFGRQRWDVILALGLLDLIPDVEAVLNQIWWGLKQGGKLYVSAGGDSHLRELKGLFSPFLPDLTFGGNPEHFGLNNGMEILSSHFEQVSLVRYVDELVFREVEPIMAFALSEEVVSDQLGEEEQALLEYCLRELLEERGEIRVTAEKGIFRATKGVS